MAARNRPAVLLAPHDAPHRRSGRGAGLTSVSGLSPDVTSLEQDPACDGLKAVASVVASKAASSRPRLVPRQISTRDRTILGN
jgi:hypothetical protein